MANCCYYEMKVQGKKNDVDEFISILKCKDYSKPHMYRVGSADIDNEYADSKTDTYIAYISGECAWSVESCMTQAGYYRTRGQGDPNATYLQKESERLSLAIEVFSSEEGFCFSERYVYIKGEEVVNHYVDRNVYYMEDYDDADHMNEELGTSFTQEMFENSESYIEGGYGEYDFTDYSDVFTVNS